MRKYVAEHNFDGSLACMTPFGSESFDMFAPNLSGMDLSLKDKIMLFVAVTSKEVIVPMIGKGEEAGKELMTFINKCMDIWCQVDLVEWILLVPMSSSDAQSMWRAIKCLLTSTVDISFKEVLGV